LPAQKTSHANHRKADGAGAVARGLGLELELEL